MKAEPEGGCPVFSEPAFVEIAQEPCPGGQFFIGDTAD